MTESKGAVTTSGLATFIAASHHMLTLPLRHCQASLSMRPAGTTRSWRPGRTSASRFFLPLDSGGDDHGGPPSPGIIALCANHQQLQVLYCSRQVQVRKCTLLTCQIRCRADKCIPLASLQTATGTAVRTYIPGTCIPGIYIAL